MDVSDEIARAELTVPATQEHLRYARLLASSMGDRIGFDYEALEDLRTAVHEVCVHIVEQVDDEEALTLTMVGRADRLEVSGWAMSAPDRPPTTLDPLAAAIVGAICDGYEVEHDGACLRFRLLKRLEGAR